MNKLEVGMYVRTKEGTIGKLMGSSAYNGDNVAVWTSTTKDGIQITPIIDKNTIVKASHNIIDLIEVGDYVNGEIVTKVSLDNIECNYIETDYSYNRKGLRNKDIKSIVTKEQFSSMEYRLGE